MPRSSNCQRARSSSGVACSAWSDRRAVGRVRHHTKDKGDIGVACVITHLLKHGIQVALPLSEHLPFDLIAIHLDGRMVKVSVKYRALSKGSVVSVGTRSIWSDRNGIHNKRHKPGDYDAVSIHCADTDECYYVLASELSSSCTTLRIAKPGNNQATGVRMARWFIDPDRMFPPAPVAQWIEQAASNRQAEGPIPSGGAAPA